MQSGYYVVEKGKLRYFYSTNCNQICLINKVFSLNMFFSSIILRRFFVWY